MNAENPSATCPGNNHAYLQPFPSNSVGNHQPPRRYAPVVQYLAHPNEHLLRAIRRLLHELHTTGVGACGTITG